MWFDCGSLLVAVYGCYGLLLTADVGDDWSSIGVGYLWFVVCCLLYIVRLFYVVDYIYINIVQPWCVVCVLFDCSMWWLFVVGEGWFVVVLGSSLFVCLRALVVPLFPVSGFIHLSLRLNVYFI